MPEEPYTIPFGEANSCARATTSRSSRSGGWCASRRRRPSSSQSEGIACEVVDPRTTSPLDEETILDSVENTGRLVVVDESQPRCSIAADIAARVAEQAFASLQTAPSLVTAPHSPVPFAPELEDAYVPTAETIMDAVRTTVGAEARR